MIDIYRVLSKDEAAALTSQLMKAKWQQGRARTKELTGTVKVNKEIRQHPDLQTIGNRINAKLQGDWLPKMTFLPKFNRYDAGDKYKLHTDAPWMGDVRTDISCTLFLNEDYDGGELMIGGEAFKCGAGLMVVYDCGVPHEVNEVTRGSRLCAVTWVQSRIRCPEKRRLVTDYRKFLSRIESNHDLFQEAGKFHSALLRRWSE